MAQPNEPGVFIGKIKPNNPSRAFLGYVDKAASDKKVVRDVFTFGDSAFISGSPFTYICFLIGSRYLQLAIADFIIVMITKFKSFVR